LKQVKIIPFILEKKKAFQQKKRLCWIAKISKRKKYFKLSGLSISDDNQLATYAIDLVGKNLYFRSKNLITGEILSDKIKTRQVIPPGQVIINYFLYYPRCKYLAF
jgi:oligopeptidase B